MTTHRTLSLRTTAILLGLLAVLVLAACGGSSTKSTTTNTVPAAAKSAGASPDTPTVTVPKTAPSAAAVSYRKCLEAHGAGLPRLVPGPGGSIAAGHLVPPKGVSKATYESAVKACGGAVGTKAEAKKSLAAFVSCMTANGIKPPKAASTSGVYAYLNEYRNPKFSPALKKCAPLLTSVGAKK